MKEAIKKRMVRRLKILEGQVRGLQNMVAKEAYCVDILRQSSAAKHALSSIESMMLENHLSTHVIDQIRSGKESRSIKEIMGMHELSKK